MMVRVPFGGRKLEGFVIEISTACQYPEEKVREIECVLGREPVFGSSELSMAQWVPRGEIAVQPDDFSLTNHMICLFRDGKA